jgi:hypothetical protein
VAWHNGMSTAGFSQHPRIGPLPWVYVRRDLAKQWGIPPWEVDVAALEEIQIELAIRSIEAEVRGN